MTRKERVKLAVSHNEPDRPPIQMYLTPEVQVTLENYFKGQSVLDAFEVDFRTVYPISLRETNDPRNLTMPAGVEFSGKAEVYDYWWTGYSKVKNSAGGEYMEASDQPIAQITTIDQVKAYPWPSADMYDYTSVPAEIEKVEDFVVCVGDPGIPDIINGVSRCRGMEQVLMDIALLDEVGVAIIDARVDFYYEFCRRTLEAGNGKIDILWLGEDLGSQKGPTMSPACFESFFRPRIEKFYKLAHEYGALAMMHSCGSTRALQPRLIEMGLDILDAVQPEPVGMEPEGLKADFGDKLTYCGMISTQQTLPHGTVEECRAEARHRLDVIAKGGGYIFSPAHCIQPDTPLENILAIYEEATGKKFM